jgi:hypothetical protein
MRTEGPIAERRLSCEIQEYYKNTPPVNARRTVERLLRGIPQQHLEGLEAVILCDTASFEEHYGHEEKVPTARYIQPKDGSPPSIEICVDRLIQGHEGFPLRISILRDIIFSDTLYHEVGHHINRTQKIAGQEAEPFAERWRTTLQKRYLLSNYWFIIIPLAILTAPFRRRLIKMCKSYSCKHS